MSESNKIKNGYILLSRLLLDSQVWMLGNECLRLAVYLLLTARHNREPKKFPGFTVKRGELVTSLSDIADGCQWYENRKVRQWSRQKVSRLLERLTSIGFCKHISDSYGTHLSICNYEHYQEAANYKSDKLGQTRTDPDNSVHIQEGEEWEECKEDNKKVPKKKNSLFEPPTIEEVNAYCKEKKLTIDAEHFMDHYTSNGWKVGKNKMKDWKATARNWNRNSGKFDSRPKQGVLDW